MRTLICVAIALILIGCSGCGSAPQAKKKTVAKKTVAVAKKTQPGKAKPTTSSPKADDSGGTPFPLGAAMNESPAEPATPSPPSADPPAKTPSTPIRTPEPPPPTTPPDDAGELTKEEELKYLAVAFHNYRDLYHSWPIWSQAPMDQFDKDGKPLLSWRVHLLQVDQPALFEEFHLNEPWDSEHNIKLLDKIPPSYARPGLGSKTTVLAIVGPGAFYEGKTGSTDLRDGSANTIMFVEASPEKAIPWTKPEDLSFDPKSPKSALGTISEDHFYAVFANGAVVKLRSDIPDESFTALITRSGGEKVNIKDFTR
jgi:hypothetical protein